MWNTEDSFLLIIGELNQQQEIAGETLHYSAILFYKSVEEKRSLLRLLGRTLVGRGYPELFALVFFDLKFGGPSFERFELKKKKKMWRKEVRSSYSQMYIHEHSTKRPEGSKPPQNNSCQLLVRIILTKLACFFSKKGNLGVSKGKHSPFGWRPPPTGRRWS